jgi:hypothetical protein
MKQLLALILLTTLGMHASATTAAATTGSVVSLTKAIQEQDVAALELALIQDPGAANRPDRNGNLPLYLAINTWRILHNKPQKGGKLHNDIPHMTIVKVLLRHKANPNVSHGTFISALNMAIEGSGALVYQYPCIMMLLNWGARLGKVAHIHDSADPIIVRLMLARGEAVVYDIGHNNKLELAIAIGSTEYTQRKNYPHNLCAEISTLLTTPTNTVFTNLAPIIVDYAGELLFEFHESEFPKPSLIEHITNNNPHQGLSSYFDAAKDHKIFRDAAKRTE